MLLMVLGTRMLGTQYSVLLLGCEHDRLTRLDEDGWHAEIGQNSTKTVHALHKLGVGVLAEVAVVDGLVTRPMRDAA